MGIPCIKRQLVGLAEPAVERGTGPSSVSVGAVLTEPLTIGLAVSEADATLVVGAGRLVYDVVSRPASVEPTAAADSATRQRFAVHARGWLDTPFVVAFQ